LLLLYLYQLELCEYDSAKNSKLCDGSNHLDALGSSEEKKEPLVTETESEMRGIHAKSHILPNSICMAVPRKCLITVEMGMATPIGQAILQSDLDLDAPKHIFLMVYLLWDRKVNKHRR
jgi:histone-lysine N-methyltransferase SETD3